MNIYADEFEECFRWVEEQEKAGMDWDQIRLLGLSKDCSEEEVDERLIELIDYDGWDDNLNREKWEEFLDEYIKTMPEPTTWPIDVIDNAETDLPFAKTERVSDSFEKYLEFLKSEGFAKDSLENIKRYAVGLHQHLKADTRGSLPTRGLVCGSVQSGKTAYMIGLVSEAADHNFNMIIVFSGMLENLREQTQRRFKADLQNTSKGVDWKVLDFTGEDEDFSENELDLNPYPGDKKSIKRYVIVCLKQKDRLAALINWLYSNQNICQKLRILVVDDEADQASVNTAEITEDVEQERKTINRLICNLVHGKKSDGASPKFSFQAMNYVSFTATPYANLLNEAREDSLYPADYVCALPEPLEYFGNRQIIGDGTEENPGLNAVREVTTATEKSSLSDELADAISWFVCSVAIMRMRGYKKPLSMLIHASLKQDDHKEQYETVKLWLTEKQKVIKKCREVYEREAGLITAEDVEAVKPGYLERHTVIDQSPNFETILPEIRKLLDGLCQIGDVNDPNRFSQGLHLCVDNSEAGNWGRNQTSLRLSYPSKEQLKALNTAPAFVVIGGNTLARGLTLEGLVCSYFSRSSLQVDSLMQMARWCGFRIGYETLQRIWMPEEIRQRFCEMVKMDSALKRELHKFMIENKPPREFGPRISVLPAFTKLKLTGAMKAQSAKNADTDFRGYSCETTHFTNDESLKLNANVLSDFVKKITEKCSCPEEKEKGYLWKNISFKEFVSKEFVDKYRISEFYEEKNLIENIPDWVNANPECNEWNVALVSNTQAKSYISWSDDLRIGMIERSCKTVNNKKHISIGSLRSGIDALFDVDIDSLTEEQKIIYSNCKKEKKDLIEKRSLLGLKDKPLLLIYTINKSGSQSVDERKRMDALENIVGFSIVISGEKNENPVQTVQIKL